MKKSVIFVIALASFIAGYFSAYYSLDRQIFETNARVNELNETMSDLMDQAEILKAIAELEATIDTVGYATSEEHRSAPYDYLRENYLSLVNRRAETVESLIAEIRDERTLGRARALLEESEDLKLDIEQRLN